MPPTIAHVHAPHPDRIRTDYEGPGGIIERINARCPILTEVGSTRSRSRRPISLDPPPTTAWTHAHVA